MKASTRQVNKQGGFSYQHPEGNLPTNPRWIEFGRRLRSLRHAARVNQDELAWAIRIDHTYLSKIENGREAPPSEATLRLLAEKLDIDPLDLICAAGKVPSELIPILTATSDVARFLLAAQELTPEQWRELTVTIRHVSAKLAAD